MERQSSTRVDSRTPPATNLSATPRLEDDIDELEELHHLRSHAYGLRNQGQAALRALVEGDQAGVDWAPRGNEPDDFIEKSLVLLALSKGPGFGPWVLDDKYHEDSVAEYSVRSLVAALNAIPLEDILEFDFRDSKHHTRRQCTRGDLRTFVRTLAAEQRRLTVADPAADQEEITATDTYTLPRHRDRTVEGAGGDRSQAAALLDDLDSLLRPKAPVLQAARTLQALLAVPGQGLSRGALVCYGAIVHELYTAAPPDRTVGSARTRAGGHHTAFMTSECTRSIKGFAKMLDRSAEFLETLVSFYDAWIGLGDSALLPAAWIQQEQRRLGLEYTNRFNGIWPECAFPLRPVDQGAKSERPRLFAPDHAITADSVEQFLRAVLQIVCECIRQAAIAAQQVKAEFAAAENAARQIAGADAKLMADDAMLSLSNLHSALTLCSNAHAEPIRVLLNNGTTLVPNWQSLRVCIRQLAVLAGNGARLVLERLDPASHYLESVLDRELTSALAEPMHVWNPAELACAAAAYGALHKDRRHADHRLENARELLDQALAADGTFQTQLTLELEDSGYTLTLVWSEAIKAFAQVLQLVNHPIRPSLVRRLLVRFEKTAVPSEGARGPQDDSASRELRKTGWTHDQPRFPRWAYRWTTALAVLAVDRVARMLDQRINARVQRHFSSRPGADMEAGKRIGTLFYPDYGLAAAGPQVDYGDTGKRESVAMVLEQMRSQTLGLPTLPGYSKKAVSAVFYGPPGTGKTTLMEALAGSAGVLFVEVTPSDIARAGEQWVESRARAVFRALSFLSNAVVCFDEFEPVLKRRKSTADESSSSMIDWLTSSMLPKLKLLYDRASEQSVAFALQTNVLGSIDPAAVRRGRFDYRIGVYPPDALSRVGRLCFALAPYGVDLDEEHRKRILDVVRATAGGAMTSLARRGFYSPPRVEHDGKPKLKDATLHAYVLRKLVPHSIHFGTRDAHFKTQCPTAAEVCKDAILSDYLNEWATVNAWDSLLEGCSRDGGDCWADVRLALSVDRLASHRGETIEKVDAQKEAAQKPAL